MKTITLYLVSTTLLGFTTSVTAEIIAWESCAASDENPVDSCIVHQVDIEPCVRGAYGGSCRLPRGRPASFSFDFTPNFSGGGLQTSVIWKHIIMDLPMDEAFDDPNPCTSTPCPVASGTRQRYNRTITLFESSWPSLEAEAPACVVSVYVPLREVAKSAL